METIEARLDKLKCIYRHCTQEATKNWALAEKAKTADDYSRFCERHTLYDRFARRCSQLAYSIQSTKVFGVPVSWLYLEYRDYLKDKAARKLERKTKFETTYRFSIWFMQESLGADYGTFKCDCCAREFYHSPTTVYLGKNKVHESACGHCVNTIAVHKNNSKAIFY